MRPEVILSLFNLLPPFFTGRKNCTLHVCTMKLSGVSIISKKWRNFQSNLVVVVVLVLESKGLHCLLWGHLRSLLHLKKVTMILFTHNLPLLSFKMKSSSFSLVYDKQTRPLFLAMAIFFFCLRSEKPRDSLLSHQPLSACKDCGYHE